MAMNRKIYARNKSSWEAECCQSYHRTQELTVQEVKQGILLPPDKWNEKTGEFCGGVCDAQGRFMTGLQRTKPPGAGWYGMNAAYEVNPADLVYDDECVIFGGVLIHHFGHFILECLGRLWFVLENRQLSYRIAFLTEGDVCSWFFAFFELLDIPKEKILLVEKPTRFRQIIVPEEAVHSWHYYTDKYLLPYQYLRENADRVYRGDTAPNIFLTRGKLAETATVCINEEYFVQFFQQKGYVPVELEELPLAQQIYTISHARKIAAIMGSLTHWALFCQPDTEFLMLTRTGTDTLMSQCMVNEASGVDWCIVDVSMNFLHTARSYGVCLLGPTVYWQEFVADRYGEKAPPMNGKAYHDYLLAWSDYYLLPMNETFVNSRDFSTVLRVMNHELHLNDMVLNPGNNKKHFVPAYNYALDLYRQGKLLQAWDEIINYERQGGESHLLIMLLKAYILRGQSKCVSEVELLGKLLQNYSESKDKRRLADAYSLLGEALRMLGDSRPAVEAFMLSAQMEPDLSGKVTEISNAIFTANALADIESEGMEKMYAEYRHNLKALDIVPYSGHDWQHEKIRVGYLSTDWRRHPVAHFIRPLLFDYNEDRFSVFVYQLNAVEDDVTRMLRKSRANWREMAGSSHADIAAQIYADEIDILLDLGGHTANNVLPVLAYRPAKWQMSGIGYFNSTGIDECDGFLSDVYCSPKPQSVYFRERLLRMPHCHFCYQPLTELPPTAQPPCLKNGYITFGSFNNFAKVNDRVLNLWRNIMEMVPNSRLLLKHELLGEEEGRAYTAQRLERLGLPLDRIEMRGYEEDYLSQYGCMDIALDPFPYTGGVTTCEALYMGVPVITLRGNRHGANFGYSFLANIGLGELAAATEAEYVRLAVSLSEDKEIIIALRNSLRDRMRQSPLMDGKSYMLDLETIYESIMAEKKYGTIP